MLSKQLARFVQLEWRQVAHHYQRYNLQAELSIKLKKEYMEALKSKQSELELQRCKANSPDIQSLRKNIQLELTEANNVLKKERHHVADLLVSLGEEPTDGYNS